VSRGKRTEFDVSEAMKSAAVSMAQVGGRTLRVATWRLDEPSEHLPVLFFNGIGANIEAVAPLAQTLTERPFIMFDMPGIGESPDPVMPYNPFTMSWTAAQLLDQLGVDDVDVMGISWGGGMAQHFSMQHASRVRRVVLIATSAGMLMMPGSPKALTKMANPRRYIDPGSGQIQGARRAYVTAQTPFPARLYVSIDVHARLDQRACIAVSA